MGNASSSEAGAKTQKLSKVRVARQVPVEMQDCGNLPICDSRYSSSYLAASYPISTPIESHFPPRRDSIPEHAIQELGTPSRRFSRGSQWMSDNRVPESSSFSVRDARSNSLYAEPPRHRPGRASSMVYHDVNRPLVRTQSWHGHRLDNSTWPPRDEPYGLQRRPSGTGPEVGQGRHPEMTHLARTPSDLSLYIPVRRRSVIQTPGVATRRERDPPSAPNRSRSTRQKTLPPPPADQASRSSKAKASLGIPVHPRHADMQPLQERASTPCDLDYQQLGGHKFGSLRIMNGSPPSSPPPEAGRPLPAHAKSLDQTVRPLVAPLFDDQFTFDKTRGVGSPRAREQPASMHDEATFAVPSGDNKVELDRSDSGVGSTSSESSESSRQALSKADSGYGSNGSLRSLRSEDRAQEPSKSRLPGAGAIIRKLSLSKLRKSSEKLSRQQGQEMASRRSCYIMADFEAATSKISSLRLRHGRSVTNRLESQPPLPPVDGVSGSRQVKGRRMRGLSEPRKKMTSQPSLPRSQSQIMNGQTSMSDSETVSPPPRRKSLRPGHSDPGVPPPIPSRFRPCQGVHRLRGPTQERQWSPQLSVVGS